MKKLNKKWIIAIGVAVALTVSCVAVAAAIHGSTSSQVSEQEAKEIALAHAGISEGDVSALRIDRDLENGREVYSVEFNAGGKEYDYDVRISDGEIVKSSYEPLDDDNVLQVPETVPAGETGVPAGETNAPTADAGASNGGQSTSTSVTAEQARAAALAHAGVAEADARFLNIREDYEDGVAVYEIEFYAGNTEYDYDIVKSTGEILKYDHDVEGFTPSGGSGSSGAGQAKISLEEARSLALARVSGATESNIRIELDWDDGKSVYEGEIRYNGMEYDFGIDASTGNFLEWSSDYDD